jgi:alcohol dehydrogenase class IV
MRNFTFYPGPRIISGDGSPPSSPICCPAGPCLFVTDEQLVGLGLTDACREALAGSGREPVLFDQVEADPSKERCSRKRSSRVALRAPSRWSALAAEARWMSPSSPPTCSAPATISTASGEWTSPAGERLPLILVPTTAGTGSEATPVSIITCEGGTKMGVNARPLTADWAALDASLTLGPARRNVTAATGIDAIVHCDRGLYVGEAQEPDFRRPGARSAAPAGRESADRVRGARHLEARSAMLLGAHLAGVAFANAPVAGVHALAYPLGGLHHLPHGVSNALMLSHVLLSTIRGCARPLCGACPNPRPGVRRRGKPGARARTDRRARPLAQQSGIALRLRDYGIGFDEAPLLAREAMKQTRLLVNNPCPIEEDDARRLYEAAW